MRIPLRFLLVVLPLLVPSVAPASGKARHVVVIVWEGMRPDFVTEQNCPTLYDLTRNGVNFTHHHSVYPSATEVNGTALSTGAYPVHDGIIANSEYRPRIDALKSFHTETAAAVRKGDALAHGRYVRLATLAEIVRRAGGKAVVAGAKPIALLADRLPRVSSAAGINLFAGSTLPEGLLDSITTRYGEFPKDDATKPTRNDWTAQALIGSLWGDEVPDFSFLWMNEPDLAQHRTGPGSAQSLAAIRNADDNLASVLKALESRGVRDKTDLIVVSDHGCSTISAKADLVEALQKAGLKAAREFKTKPATGEILVVSNTGSTLLYVVGHQEKVVQQIVNFLQQWEYTGIIFTRKRMAGTFGLSQVHLDSGDAPDILVSLRWTADKNKNGTPGLLAADVSSFGPGQGGHVSLSPYDMHGTLVAAGPDFRSGMESLQPTGNIDVAPTVLWILGIKPPKPMDGRVLGEALTIPAPEVRAHEPRKVEASCEREGSVWHQYLDVSEVNGVEYFDEGNGSLTRR